MLSRAVSNLSNHAMEFGSPHLSSTGGTITIVDPVNNSSYNSVVIPSAESKTKTYRSTLRLGDGISFIE
jgi:muramidase (phage lysozyme)